MYTQVNKVNTYKKIAFNFLFLVIILAALIIYFVFYKVEIIITPIKEDISVNFIVDIQDTKDGLNESEDVLAGAVNETELEGEKEFLSTGTKQVFSKMTGEVTIINKENVAQPLIATTRLLSPDNILFRIKDTVTVPAQGEVVVSVYADDENLNKVIEPTKFTIPGLSAKLQEKIYAENKSNLGETKEAKVITQEDINIAKQNLADELYTKAKEQFNLANKDKVSFSLIGKIPKIETVDQKEILFSETDKIADEEGDKFILKLKIRATEIAFDENVIRDLANKKIIEAIPDDKKFISLDRNSFNYVAESFDTQSKIAKIKVYASGDMAISENSVILDKSGLAGKKLQDVKDELKLSQSIEDVQITSPFNILKFIPKNKDKILITIKTEDVEK